MPNQVLAVKVLKTPKTNAQMTTNPLQDPEVDLVIGTKNPQPPCSSIYINLKKPSFAGFFSFTKEQKHLIGLELLRFKLGQERKHENNTYLMYDDVAIGMSALHQA
jgi:hypothetical protein